MERRLKGADAMRIAGWVLVTATACASTGPSAESVARARAADEFHCPDAQITSRVVSDPTIRLNACGQDVTYTCPPSYYGKHRDYTRTCIREPNFGR
jgi:hypothetical protein